MKIYNFHGRCNASGVRIKELRTREGITQEQLAARMQVEGVQINQKGISRIEAGERIVADFELMIFAKVLKTSPQHLLDSSEPKDPSVFR